MDDVELMQASFHPSALEPGDGRPLVTLERALSALAGLVAERDRLRAVVEAARGYVELDEDTLRTLGTDGLVELIGVLRRDYGQLRAVVRDYARLQAVVEAVRGAFARTDQGWRLADNHFAAVIRTGAALDQLDVSGDMGGRSEPEPTVSIDGVLYRQSRDDDPDALGDHGIVFVPVDPDGLPPHPVAELLRKSAAQRTPVDVSPETLDRLAAKVRESRTRIRLVEDEDDGGWVASIVGMPGLVGQGDSRRAAVVDLFAAVDAADPTR